MAGTIGTNVTPDGSAEYEFINKIFKFLEEEHFSRMKSEEARMARIIANHIGHGGAPVMKLVEKKYEQAMEEKLQDKDYKIPYMVVYDNLGNAAFIIRDSDTDKFLKAQTEVFSMSTDFYAQLTVEELCQIARKEKELIHLHFDTKEDFDEAQTKMYSAGVVCAIDKDTQTLYVNPADLYNSCGSDLASFELEWAANQSMNDNIFRDKEGDSVHQKLRDAQAKYDMDIVREFAESVKRGEPAALMNAENRMSKYISMEADGLHIWDKSGTHKKDVMHLTKEMLSGISAEQIGAIISRQKFETKDAIVIKGKDIEEFSKLNASAAKEWSMNYLEKNGKSPRPSAKDFGLQEKDLEIQSLKKNELKEMLGRVEFEARARVEAISDHNTPPIKKRELLKQEIYNILNDSQNMIVQDFIHSPGYFVTQSEKAEWVKNISVHFVSENEDMAHEAHIGKSSIQAILEECRQKIMGRDRTEAEYEREDFDE